MTWVTPEEVITAWRGSEPPEADDAGLAKFIEYAEDAILQVYPGIQSRIDSGEIPAIRLERVVVSVVIRAWEVGFNPQTSFSETIGSFSMAGSFASGVKGIYLTKEEIASLAPRNLGKAFEINVDSLTPRTYDGLGWAQPYWIDAS